MTATNGLLHFSNYYRSEVPRDIVDEANVKTFYFNGAQNGTVWANATGLDYQFGLQTLGTDAQGNVFVARSAGWVHNMVYWDPSTAENFTRVYVDQYAPNRTLLRTWGSIGPGIDQFSYILDLAVDSNNNRVYVAEDGQGLILFGGPSKVDRVAVYDTLGNYQYSINGFVNSTYSMPFNNPTGIAVDAEGYLYVVDSGNKRVDKFDQNWLPIVAWGGAGSGLGESGVTPTHIAIGSNDTIFVIQRSDQEGNYLNQISMFTQKAPNTQPAIDTIPDIDGDGLLNTDEANGWNTTFTNTNGTFTIHVNSDPMLMDTDFDGLSDQMELDLGLNPRSPDTDGDGVDDLTEYNWHHSPSMNPAHFDTDNDSLPDATELTFGSDPTMPDTDDDGLTDYQEFQLNTNPCDTDTDDDGLSDYEEVQFGSDPTAPDSDGDFMFDGAEKEKGTNPQDGDSDNDQLIDGYEMMLDTSPLKADSDGDDLPDGYEVELWLNPLSNDTDADGLSDSVELNNGTSPWSLDSDFDGVPDNGDETHIIEKTEEIEKAQPTPTPKPSTTAPPPPLSPSTQPTNEPKTQEVFDSNKLVIAVATGIIVGVVIALVLTKRRLKISTTKKSDADNNQ